MSCFVTNPGSECETANVLHNFHCSISDNCLVPLPSAYNGFSFPPNSRLQTNGLTWMTEVQVRKISMVASIRNSLANFTDDPYRRKLRGIMVGSPSRLPSHFFLPFSVEHCMVPSSLSSLGHFRYVTT